MQSTTHAARMRGHLSRHERQRLARADAFSRSTPAAMPGDLPVRLSEREVELIERLVRRDRTAVSSALLAIAGIGAGEAIRRAVLTRVSEAAREAKAEGAISARRAGQIVRHASRTRHPRPDEPETGAAFWQGELLPTPIGATGGA
jgi:hypothetical protein